MLTHGTSSPWIASELRVCVWGGGACVVSLNSILSLQHTFEEAEKGFDETLAKEKGMNRDDRIHGALLILNELVRISSMEGEVSHASGGRAPVSCATAPAGNR